MIFTSLQRLLGTALATAQARLELLGTEIELEKRRILGAIFLAALALLLIGLGLVLLTGFIVLLFWEGYQLAATATLTLLFLLLGLLLLVAANRRMSQGSYLFSASAAMLATDQAELRSSVRDEQP